MAKTFEDYFTEVQADMVDICLEYVDDAADKIYIYCSSEDGVIMADYFYKIGNHVARRHRLNHLGVKKKYDVSVQSQEAVLNVLLEDIERIKEICKEHDQPMPTEMKLVYDVQTHGFEASYQYDPQYSHDEDKVVEDIVDAWFAEVEQAESRS